MQPRRPASGERGSGISVLVAQHDDDDDDDDEILDETDCISHSSYTLGKGINPIILPPVNSKWVNSWTD